MVVLFERLDGVSSVCIRNVDRVVWRKFRHVCAIKGVSMGVEVSRLLLKEISGENND